MISLRDGWRIFLIFFTFAELMLASAVGIQRGILPTSSATSYENAAIIEHYPAFAKQEQHKERLYPELSSSRSAPRAVSEHRKRLPGFPHYLGHVRARG